MTRKHSSRRSRSNRSKAASHEWDHRQSLGMALHDSEKFLVGFLTLFLVFLPWALGSTHLWAHAIGSFLGLCGLVAALLPRHGETHTVTVGGQVRRLLLFPVFWIGLLLMGYFCIQGVNTGWRVEGTDGYAWLEEIPHAAFLPAGVGALPDGFGAWHWVLLLLGPIMASCAVWVGVTRRKSINFLGTAVVINAAILTLVGFVQVARGHTEILGFYEPENPVFLSTFPFHWHGAAYFTIVLSVALGLGLYHYLQARRSFRRSSPSGLYEFVAFILLLMVTFSYSSQTATIAGVMVAAFICMLGYRHLAVDAPASRKAFLAGLSLVLILAGGVFTHKLATRQVERAPDGGPAALATGETEHRAATDAVALQLLRERPLFGWGAGAFELRYRQVAQQLNLESVPPSLSAENSARDLSRLAAETGLIGLLLWLALPIAVARYYLSRRVLHNVFATFLLFGFLAGLILMARTQVLTNMAFLGTWGVFAVAGAVLVRIESAVRARTETAS